jgi:hypothetical protein
VLGVALIGGYNVFVHQQREIGKRDLLIAQHERTNADLRHQADSLSKVYRTDTLRLTKIRRVTDSLTVTVDQWKHDTLKVVEYVHQADTTIKACTAALQTCEDRVRIAQLGWANARSEIARIKAIPKQGWIARHTAASVGVGATYGQDGRVAVGPTVSFGFRFFP